MHTNVRAVDAMESGFGSEVALKAPACIAIIFECAGSIVGG